jgi:hypothetical protein
LPFSKKPIFAFRSWETDAMIFSFYLKNNVLYFDEPSITFLAPRMALPCGYSL